MKEHQAVGNKRYSKCGYACSLKHLKSLSTFVWQTVEHQFISALAIASEH